MPNVPGMPVVSAMGAGPRRRRGLGRHHRGRAAQAPAIARIGRVRQRGEFEPFFL